MKENLLVTQDKLQARALQEFGEIGDVRFISVERIGEVEEVGEIENVILAGREAVGRITRGEFEQIQGLRVLVVLAFAEEDDLPSWMRGQVELMDYSGLGPLNVVNAVKASKDHQDGELAQVA